MDKYKYNFMLSERSQTPSQLPKNEKGVGMNRGGREG